MGYEEDIERFKDEISRAINISDRISWIDKHIFCPEKARKIGATYHFFAYHQPQISGMGWEEFMKRCEFSAEQRWLCIEETSQFLYHEIDGLSKQGTMKSANKKSVFIPFMINVPAEEPEYSIGVVGIKLYFNDMDTDFPVEKSQQTDYIDRHLYIPDKNIVEYVFDSVGSRISKAAAEKNGSVLLTRMEEFWMPYEPEKTYIPYNPSSLKYQ